ncbi:MAG: hypothetical protein ACRDRI_17240 [Pseudonocardiaceae bacterium]
MDCPLCGIRWLDDAYGRSDPRRGQVLRPSGGVHAEHPQQVRDRDEVAVPGAEDGHGELTRTGEVVRLRTADAQHGRRGEQICRGAQSADLSQRPCA